MKKMNQLDYECRINERVWWPNLKGERFEGVIVDWSETDPPIATLKLDNGTYKKIEC